MESGSDRPGRGGVEGRRYRVTGRVQGVGFRWWTAQIANEMAVIGWVKNRADSTVEVEAWGDADVLDRFERRLLDGPPSSRVEEVIRISAGVDLPTGGRFSILG